MTFNSILTIQQPVSAFLLSTDRLQTKVANQARVILTTSVQSGLDFCN